VSHLFDDAFDDGWRYERFIVTIQQKAGISWAKAEQAGRATLQTLGERLAWGEARDIAEDLPSAPREWLLSSAQGDAEPFGPIEFVRRVAEREGVDFETAERHARAVLIALARLVRGRELADALAELPKDYESLLGEAVARPRDASAPEPLSYEAFLERVQNRAGLDRERAERAVEAVLETLAERISGGEVDDLIEALPEPLRPPLERGRERSGGKARRMSLDEFVARVARRESIDEETALDHARAVFATLRETIPDKERSDLLHELPRGYQEALL
jgi:uncharacterized protein (DUF2267 family)